jgi:hypothetical protein
MAAGATRVALTHSLQGDPGQPPCCEDSAVRTRRRTSSLTSFYVDFTDAFNAEIQQSVTNELEVIVSHRGIIEQAKGMVMMTYQVSGDAAFGILKWRSQEHNVKLAVIAQQLVDDLPRLMDANSSLQAPVDHYLMTFAPTRPDSI